MSAQVEAAISDVVKPLRQIRSGARWVRPANLHLTLRFLGDSVHNNLLVALDGSLNEIALRTSPFILGACGIGGFPDLDRPRVIWVGLIGEELIRLAREVEDAAVRAGFTAEGRPYSPHLTIGRVRDLKGWQQIRCALDGVSNRDFGSTLISEMILYRSILGGAAPQYQVLACYRFN
jgi:RNA 2',3'-cyclic 3'-phosphodiesterase